MKALPVAVHVEDQRSVRFPFLPALDSHVIARCRYLDFARIARAGFRSPNEQNAI